jgi:hypothetical protein
MGWVVALAVKVGGNARFRVPPGVVAPVDPRSASNTYPKSGM